MTQLLVKDGIFPEGATTLDFFKKAFQIMGDEEMKEFVKDLQNGEFNDQLMPLFASVESEYIKTTNNG